MRKIERINGNWWTTKRRADWRTFKGVWYRAKRHKNLYRALKDLTTGL